LCRHPVTGFQVSATRENILLIQYIPHGKPLASARGGSEVGQDLNIRFSVKKGFRRFPLKLTVQLKVSEETNRVKLLRLDELYAKYQMALKLFYNYAKENQLHRLEKRLKIERELQKLYYTIKESLNLHSQLVQSARRDVVNDIMSWLETGGEYPKLSEKPLTLVP